MTSIAGWITLILSATVIFVAIFVVIKARQENPQGYDDVYRVRKYYAALLIAGFVAILIFSLPKNPYSAYREVEPAVYVDVEGSTWSWVIRRQDDDSERIKKPTILPQGEIIDFAVTAKDVNHGFGIYNDDGELLAQTQAMPGYTNHLRFVFDEPGLYHVACLEFCGLLHHNMLWEIEIQ